MDFEREQPLLCICLVPEFFPTKHKIYGFNGSSMLHIHNPKVGFFDTAIKQGPAKKDMGKRKTKSAVEISLL